MQIDIIGSGNIGGNLARLAVAGGFDIVITNRRGPTSLAGFVAELGPRARDGDIDLGGTQSEYVARLFPRARVVKAFKTIRTAHLGVQGDRGRSAGERRVSGWQRWRGSRDRPEALAHLIVWPRHLHLSCLLGLLAQQGLSRPAEHPVAPHLSAERPTAHHRTSTAPDATPGSGDFVSA